MSDLKVVSNAGPLISLSSINQLNLLKLLFGTVFIPQAVYREVVILGDNRPGQTEVLKADWIRQLNVGNTAMSRLMLDKLDEGESESIVLASDLNADYIILDEKLARRKAKRIGLSVVGTLGIFLMAKKASHIQDVASLLADLEKTPFRMDNRIRLKILEKAGE
jgi:predicted nucleic acid-binding protein